MCITSAELIASATRLHDAMYRHAEALGMLDDSCPSDVLLGYGDLQGALKRLGLTY